MKIFLPDIKSIIGFNRAFSKKKSFLQKVMLKIANHIIMNIIAQIKTNLNECFNELT
jgi:hypothetical protein